MKMQKTASRLKAFNEVDKQCIPNSKEQRLPQLSGPRRHTMNLGT